MRCTASCAARCSCSSTIARAARPPDACGPGTRASAPPCAAEAGDEIGLVASREPTPVDGTRAAAGIRPARESTVELVAADHPLLPAAGAPLAPRARGRLRSAQGARSLSAGDLNPALLRIELLCIAAAQHLECFVGVLPQVDGADRILMPEPVGCHEVGDQEAADLVSVVVGLDRIADLTCPERALWVLVGAVEPGIHRHLADLVARADAQTRLVGLDRLHEYLGDRQALVGEVVVGQGVPLVAVVEEHDPPRARRRRLLIRIENEGGRPDTPHGIQIVVPLGVESGNHFLHIGIGAGRRLVDHGDLQHGTLLTVRLFACPEWRTVPLQRSIFPLAPARVASAPPPVYVTARGSAARRGLDAWKAQ